MDPLTALGLVANILQLVSTGHKIVSFAREIRSSADGVPEELKQLNIEVVQMRHKIENEAPSTRSSVSGDDEVALKTVAQECLGIADTLVERLAVFQVKQSGLVRRWLESYFMAGKYLLKKEEISRLKSRLFELEGRFTGWWETEQSL